MKNNQNDQIKQHVQARYREIAIQNGSVSSNASAASCCSSGCCSSPQSNTSEFSARLGYSKTELAEVPEGSNLRLGCGNPQAISEMKPGEIILDLGSGAGFDCFLAAARVGSSGKVIGVDMTWEMVLKARANVLKHNYRNVEFRLGEIEYLPLADNSVDVIISNCVINLSPDKTRVFQEAWRVLRNGGRLAVSDVVAITPIPEQLKHNLNAHSGCISGAAQVKELVLIMTEAGFCDISIDIKDDSALFIRDWFPGTNLENHVRSAAITAYKKVK